MRTPSNLSAAATITMTLEKVQATVTKLNGSTQNWKCPLESQATGNANGSALWKYGSKPLPDPRMREIPPGTWTE